jgi:hypothetical protein
MGNYVLYAAASNTEGFLWSDTSVFKLTLIGLFGANRAYFHVQNYDLQAVFL